MFAACVDELLQEVAPVVFGTRSVIVRCKRIQRHVENVKSWTFFQNLSDVTTKGREDQRLTIRRLAYGDVVSINSYRPCSSYSWVSAFRRDDLSQAFCLVLLVIGDGGDALTVG